MEPRDAAPTQTGGASPYLPGLIGMNISFDGKQTNVSRSSSSTILRIAQIAPLYESVPPRLYGGTERVVSFITEELASRGHEVTLFASGDSKTAATLEAVCQKGLRLAGTAELGPTLQLPMLSNIYESAGKRFDIIHSHLEYWAFPFNKMTRVPTVSTIHSRLDIPHLHPLYNYYRQAVLVSISDAQRKPLPGMNWAGTVGHGLPRDLLHFSDGSGKYLAFLGRISPEKRPDLAIEIARRAGIPLKIAAKVDNVDRDYFETLIKPQLAPPDIEYIGEISKTEKSDFLGGALALLFPIDWPEPFGLTMIEAMACGTPVIARPCGSVPEVLTDGLTGFIAADLDDLVAAVAKVDRLSRRKCRQEFERRFSVEVMVDKYERIYRNLIDAAANREAWSGPARANDGQQPSAVTFSGSAPGAPTTT
jgi:glycosyltransferase involved in cell wall biosynthesis